MGASGPAAQAQALLALSTQVLPVWARQLEMFILADMNELDSARAVAGALLAGGTINDPNEIAFLEGRLRELERNVSHKTREQVR